MSQSHNIDSLKEKAQVLTAFGCDDLMLLLSLSSGSYICTLQQHFYYILCKNHIPAAARCTSRQVEEQHCHMMPC